MKTSPRSRTLPNQFHQPTICNLMGCSIEYSNIKIHLNPYRHVFTETLSTLLIIFVFRFLGWTWFWVWRLFPSVGAHVGNNFTHALVSSLKVFTCLFSWCSQGLFSFGLDLCFALYNTILDCLGRRTRFFCCKKLLSVCSGLCFCWDYFVTLLVVFLVCVLEEEEAAIWHTKQLGCCAGMLLAFLCFVLFHNAKQTATLRVALSLPHIHLLQIDSPNSNAVTLPHKTSQKVSKY